jgi:general secretion pathway protein G
VRKRLVKGITVLELMIAMAIMATLSMIAMVLYRDYSETGRVAAAVVDIRDIEGAIVRFESINFRLPDDLTEAGKDHLRDPWGNPYQYLNLAGANPGDMRKDRNLVPINSDYDLYSMGPDGDSLPPLTAPPSRDDIVRANNGGFVGAADAY